MNQTKIGTTRLTGYLLTMLGCRGKWLLPEPEPAETVDAPKLLQIRRELEDTGLVELDFDGKLHPTEEFARLAYNMTHARGALRWKSEDRQQIFLRGPVDDLLLTCRWDLWTMELSRPSALLRWARELTASEEAGTLSAVNEPDGLPVEISPALGADRQKGILEILDIYYGGGQDDA